ncbi:hypothetical protein N9B38_01095 [bacterium]|nr:hypothetical protein [bacterium]
MITCDLRELSPNFPETQVYPDAHQTRSDLTRQQLQMAIFTRVSHANTETPPEGRGYRMAKAV